MVLVLHSNAKHLVLPPPKSCLSWQKPPRRQDHSDFRWYSDLFILHGVNLTVETNKRAREMYFDKPLYGHFYILLLPLDGKSSDQQVKRRKHPKAQFALKLRHHFRLYKKERLSSKLWTIIKTFKKKLEKNLLC